MGNIARLQPNHDDIQCLVATVTSSSALGTLAIRDTGFSIPSFQNANDDIALCTFQMPHRKKLGSALDSIHIHYYLPSAPAAGQTLLFDYAYCWFKNFDTLGALAAATWVKGTQTVTFAGTEAQYSTGLVNVLPNATHATIPAPANEDYSSILLIKITRNSTGGGSDTYPDDLGILYIDAHYITDRTGSASELNDT